MFGDETAETPEDVHAHWLRTKAIEKQRESVTDGVPLGQPGLALAAKLGSRAARRGPRRRTPRRATGSATAARSRRGAEQDGTDPEAALRAAARAYRDAIRAAEGLGAAPDGVEE